METIIAAIVVGAISAAITYAITMRKRKKYSISVTGTTPATAEKMMRNKISKEIPVEMFKIEKFPTSTTYTLKYIKP